MNIASQIRTTGASALVVLGLVIAGPAIADTNETTATDDAALNAESISAGYYHTCAVMTTGGVKCWGDNGRGQLGNNSLVSTQTPVDVSGLSSGVRSVSAGLGFTCAVLDTGGAKCWGDNTDGQLGDNTQINKKVPTDVTGLTSGVKAISVGGNHACALLDTGGVKCWGDNSPFGQLGDDTLIDKKVPTDVNGLSSGVKAISAGSSHTCVLLDTGGVKCWGYNIYGQLGDNTQTSRKVPTDVNGLTSGVKAITAGGFHTCAVTDAGAIKCWGYASHGALGNGVSSGFSSLPVDVNTLPSGATTISNGDSMTCTGLASGAAMCWGWNWYGGLGDNSTTDRDTPTGVDGLSTGVTAVTAGQYHACALLTSGALKCWGYNYYGQLGNATKTDSSIPVDVTGMTSGVGLMATTTTTPTTSTTTPTTSTTTPTTSTTTPVTTTTLPTTTTLATITTAATPTTTRAPIIKPNGVNAAELPSTGSGSSAMTLFGISLAGLGLFVISSRRIANQ